MHEFAYEFYQSKISYIEESNRVIQTSLRSTTRYTTIPTSDIFLFMKKKLNNLFTLQNEKYYHKNMLFYYFNLSTVIFL